MEAALQYETSWEKIRRFGSVRHQNRYSYLTYRGWKFSCPCPSPFGLTQGRRPPMRHPTVQVPNIGPMDHAWDLLGEWQAEFELPETEWPVHGKVTFRSWTDAELSLDPVEAAIAGIPASVPLERASAVHLTDAGG